MDSLTGRRKRGITPDKAKEMLRNPPHGQPLSPKQRGLFGLIAGGGTPTKMHDTMHQKRRKRRGKR